MSLNELRWARRMTQGTLASAMQTSQSEVSKLEQRTDTYVSTLQSYIRAWVASCILLLASPTAVSELLNSWRPNRVSMPSAAGRRLIA